MTNIEDKITEIKGSLEGVTDNELRECSDQIKNIYSDLIVALEELGYSKIRTNKETFIRSRSEQRVDLIILEDLPSLEPHESHDGCTYLSFDECDGIDRANGFLKEYDSIKEMQTPEASMGWSVAGAFGGFLGGAFFIGDGGSAFVGAAGLAAAVGYLSKKNSERIQRNVCQEFQQKYFMDTGKDAIYKALDSRLNGGD